MQCKTMSVRMKKGKGQQTIVSVAFGMSFDDLNWAGSVMVLSGEHRQVLYEQVYWAVISEHLTSKDQSQCKHGFCSLYFTKIRLVRPHHQKNWNSLIQFKAAFDLLF